MTKLENFDYQKLRAPDGSVVWVATDESVPGPYGMGSTDTEATEDLEKALAFWQKGQTPTTTDPTFKVVEESGSSEDNYWVTARPEYAN